MKRFATVFLSLFLMCLAGATVAFSESGKDIPLSKVPKNVIKAAEKAVPGIKLTEAEMRKTSKGLVYELEGTADGKKFEINLSEDGKVLKVTEGDDDDDDNEADDKDDKDED